MWSVNKGNLLLSINFGIGSGFRNHEAQLFIKEDGGKGSGLRGGGLVCDGVQIGLRTSRVTLFLVGGGLWSGAGG